MRKILRRVLERMGFEVSEAENGQVALEVIREGGAPDIALVDWNMPVMDGYEFLGNLRRMPGGDAPKVVFCTTENDVAHIARAACRRRPSAGGRTSILAQCRRDLTIKRDDAWPPL